MASKLAAACAVFATLFTSVVAQNVDPIVIKGSKFFYKTNGTQFYIKGVAYQQDFTSDGDPSAGNSSSTGYVDPLADPAGCMRDINYLTQLSTNVVRVYAVDPTKDHSQCMSILANAGIYVIADLGAPQQSINQDDPQWNTEIYQRYTSVIDALANYTNVLGFFAGNEVVTMPNNTDAAPFAKAAARDMKAYIKSKNYRQIGVGYAADDNQYERLAMSEFMDCGSDTANAPDFYGINVYSWCGNSNFQASGYAARVEQYKTWNIPVFFAEYGCIDPKPRLFTETPVLFGPLMDNVFSGGIVYLYFQETNGYGLVSVDGNSVSTLADFNNLKSQIATVSPTIVTASAYSPTNSPQACPTGVANFSAVASPLPPTPDSSLCSCMYAGLGCVPVPSLKQTSYGKLFNYVCAMSGGLCDGINANGSTGSYGQYSGCNDTQKLGYVFNQYYNQQNKGASACVFSGSAQTQATAVPSGCSARLSSANQAAGSSSGSPTSSKGGAAAMTKVAGFDLGLVWAGVVAQIALISGIGMILL